MFTALLIAILIVAGAATVVGGGLVLAAQRRRAVEGGGDEMRALGPGSQPLLERTMRDLRVGDVIQTEGRDFLVEGVVRYDEAGHDWVGGRIIDGRDIRWIYVGLERSSSGAARIYEIDSDLEMSGYPPELLVVGKTHYKFDKRGTATTRLAGDVGTLAGASQLGDESVFRCRWWLYEAAGNDTILVEQWGDDYRVLRGKKVSSTDIDMMPGS